MIIRVPVLASGHTPKAPPVRLTNERAEFGVFKVGRDDTNFKLAWFEDPPGTPVWAGPGDDILEVFPRENGVHFRGKVGDAARGC